MENQKIKVMHLIWSMGDGGAQRIVLNYLRDFKNDPDIELKLFVYSKPKASFCDNIINNEKLNVTYLNGPRSKIQIPYIKRFFNSAIAKKEWEKAIKEFKPDIVHVHISELLLNTLNPITNCKVPLKFITLHSNPLYYSGRKLEVIKKAIQKERFIPVCVTKEQVEIAKRHYGINEFEVIHNGIDINSIKEKIISKESARKIFNIPNNAYVIIGVGRLNKIKRFDLLIKAFKLVYKENNNALLIIAGDGKELKKLMKLVCDIGLENNVKFIGNQKNIIPLYCAADMLGVTSITESASLVLLEAQICGLNCVISDGVPNESIISKKVNKMKFNASLEEWSEALKSINYDGEIITDIEEYEVHNVSHKMKSVYIKYWNEFRNKENLL